MHKLDSVLVERIEARSRIINNTPTEEMPRLNYIFKQAEYLGKLLHTARQLFEKPFPAPAPSASHTSGESAISQETLWLWEQGLMLPDEVTSGKVSAVVRTYIEQLHLQRGNDPAYRLKHDIVSLYTALKEGSPVGEQAPIQEHR